MKTITFYSYKGGVGRSLALVNIASRLAEFGKKVCVIDFDLEAPGLHLKFRDIRKQNSQGIVDYVYEFSNNGRLPEKINEYTSEVVVPKSDTPITLITAGDTESSEYWKKLSSINWYELIYENPDGLAFFLKLKETIEDQIKPDFLLIDSRTGISETSGITLSLLAEEVVILAANNKENLFGAKWVIKTLSERGNVLGKSPKINFVLSRIPFTNNPQDRGKETILLQRIKRQYLEPYLNDINVIHSDRDLEESKQIKIAYGKDESNSQISIDYLKLFEVLTEDYLLPVEIERFENIRRVESLLNQIYNTTDLSKQYEYIQRAIFIDSNSLKLHIIRASIYYNMADYSKSLEDLERVISVDRNNHIANLLIIDNYDQMKEYGVAMEYIKCMLEHSPNNWEFLLKKASILVKIEKYSDAVDVYEEMINMFPELSLAYSGRGNALRLLEKFEEAMKYTYQALELDSMNWQAMITLAEIYLELNNTNEFYWQFENVLRQQPNYAQKCIIEEAVYKKVWNEERFRNLLSKYGLYID